MRIFGFGEKPVKASAIDRKRSLDSIPVVNGGVQVENDDKGRLIIHVKFKRGAGALSRFLPETSQRRIRLDEIGAFVMGRIDGSRSTRQIIDDFVARYKVNRREAELSCVEFLKSLVTRHVISIAVK